jgi:hypothetical protein
MADDRRLTDVELERHLAGDLSAARYSEATDADRARLVELQAEADAFLRSVDIGNEVRRIQQRMPDKPKRSWLRWLAPGFALAAAAAIAVLALRPKDQAPDITLKGGDVALIVHRATSGVSERLDDGDTVAVGDRIRFEVDAPRKGFVALVGVDGTGKQTVYYEGVAYTPENRLLPDAIQLDATPGDEHFTVLFSTQPFEVNAPSASVVRDEVTLHKK